MHLMTELILKLDAAEVQQVMAIYLDEDPEQALQFIKEKIVDKCAQKAGPIPQIL
jgi:hypothetical protein